MSVPRIIPKPWPGLTHAGARVIADEGRSYDFRGNRDLSFTITRDGEAVISGRKTGARKRTVELVGPEGRVGRIRPGRFPRISDTLCLPNGQYRLPTPLRPKLPVLGMKFSRLGLLGLRTHRVEVSDESKELLALGLLGYLAARSFVDG